MFCYLCRHYLVFLSSSSKRSRMAGHLSLILHSGLCVLAIIVVEFFWLILDLGRRKDWPSMQLFFSSDVLFNLFIFKLVMLFMLHCRQWSDLGVLDVWLRTRQVFFFCFVISLKFYRRSYKGAIKLRSVCHQHCTVICVTGVIRVFFCCLF